MRLANAIASNLAGIGIKVTIGQNSCTAGRMILTPSPALTGTPAPTPTPTPTATPAPTSTPFVSCEPFIGYDANTAPFDDDKFVRGLAHALGTPETRPHEVLSNLPREGVGLGPTFSVEGQVAGLAL